MLAYDRLVVGYHGCDAKVARRLLAGAPFTLSENTYDWLGSGAYFWEHGPDRAQRFAEESVRRDASKKPSHRARVTSPALVGALLQLGRCFDLLDTRHTQALANFYPAWRRDAGGRGNPLPQNRGGSPLKMLRNLDCAVINAFLQYSKAVGREFDSVRGCFWEGDPVYEGSFIRRESHIQIAIRRPEACVLGVFKPT